jgi:hypothetical protein
MDTASRTSIQTTATHFFDMIVRADTTSLKQNAIPSVASDFTWIENTIKDNQANLAGSHAAPRAPFLLKAQGTAPIPKAQFFCGVFNAQGQTSNSAEFVIPNLPPGNYGVITLDVSTQKDPYTMSFVLQQQGTDWKLGGFFLRAAGIAGHDSKWFLDRAREFKSKNQMHNSWLYFIQGRELAVAVPFMYTLFTDKLYDEIQTVKPSDFPVDGNTVDLVSSNGKTYKLTAVFATAVGQDLDLVARYQTASIADTGQTFQENMAVMKAMATKFPELREAFAGIVARGVEPSGKAYGSLMPMKDIK